MLRHLLALTLMLAAGCHLLFDGIEAVHEQSAPVDEVPSEGGSGGEDPAGGAGGIAPTCLDAETCADDGSQVCNVDLQQCTAPECTADMLCAIGEVCLPQGANAAVGACYENCIPFSDPCGDGYQCVDITGDGSDGACIPTGPADLGFRLWDVDRRRQPPLPPAKK